MEQGTSVCLVQSLDQTLYLPHPEPANAEQENQNETIMRTVNKLRTGKYKHKLNNIPDT